MTIISFPGHKWYQCNCGEGPCMFCGGGLSSCVRRKGFEGSLPTDCPGEPMQEEVVRDVYAGMLDYRHRVGWIEKMSKTWEGVK